MSSSRKFENELDSGQNSAPAGVFLREGQGDRKLILGLSGCLYHAFSAYLSVLTEFMPSFYSFPLQLTRGALTEVSRSPTAASWLDGPKARPCAGGREILQTSFQQRVHSGTLRGQRCSCLLVHGVQGAKVTISAYRLR